MGVLEEEELLLFESRYNFFFFNFSLLAKSSSVYYLQYNIHDLSLISSELALLTLHFNREYSQIFFIFSMAFTNSELRFFHERDYFLILNFKI